MISFSSSCCCCVLLFTQQFNINKVFTYPGGAFPHASVAPSGSLAPGLRPSLPTNFDLSLLLSTSAGDKPGLGAVPPAPQALYSPASGQQHLAYPALPSNTAPLPSPHALGLTAGVSPLLPTATSLSLPTAGLPCDADGSPSDSVHCTEPAVTANLPSLAPAGRIFQLAFSFLFFLPFLFLLVFSLTLLHLTGNLWHFCEEMGVCCLAWLVNEGGVVRHQLIVSATWPFFLCQIRPTAAAFSGVG